MEQRINELIKYCISDSLKDEIPDLNYQLFTMSMRSMLPFENKIGCEFDEDRYLAWIFVDGNLLQKNLINESLAEVKYIYCDYKYLDEIQELENKVKVNKQKISVV